MKTFPEEEPDNSYQAARGHHRAIGQQEHGDIAVAQSIARGSGVLVADDISLDEGTEQDFEGWKRES